MDQLEGQKVELFISCRDLLDLHTKKVSDPYVVMLVYFPPSWQEYGRTQKIDNNIDPNFTKSITIQYNFQIQQHLRFQVYDYIDEKRSNLVGKVETTLSEIVGEKDQQKTLTLYDDTNLKGGAILIRADYVNSCPDKVTIQLRGKNISTNLPNGANAFLRFYRLIKDNLNPVLVYETETIINNNNPEWKSIVLRAQTLCNGQYFMPIKIELWEFNLNGRHLLLGETAVTLDQLKNRVTEKNLINKFDLTKFVGTLFIQFNWIIPLVDFIQGGLQLNLLVAIDFTESNKDIDDITSLHYQDPKGSPSLYEQAIVSVGEILINYDYDKKVPVYGFGCKPKLKTIRSDQVNQCFPLNDNLDDPEVNGLQGIVKVYRNAVQRLVFSGPTNLHFVIQKAMQQARLIKEKKQDNYLILLILTDGETDDLKLTVDDVIASSHLPLSIILIGIGDEDFNKMKVLDNDDLSMVDSKGNISQRDLVQFVQFNKFNGNAALLTQEVLQELPDQVAQYMKLTNQHPKSAQGIQNQQTQIQMPIFNYPQF
ncbi:hypothetical protein pb186bvf_009661 [Paramecium bursaria]